MKIATIIVRFLVGALLLFAALFYFFGPPPPPQAGNMKIFSEGMDASGYLMPLVKITELLCGIAFVINRFVPLANIAILPVTINIFMVNAMLMPEGLSIAAPLLLANFFLIYVYRSHYRGVLEAK